MFLVTAESDLVSTDKFLTQFNFNYVNETIKINIFLTKNKYPTSKKKKK